ncbi:lipopolysaccharide biosynthesis protein [Tenacibaculum sp. MEBiC06402]|uniref:lipopolysaccharide biosynthesis protein n=1 Tax=unclassified Tenacibaculum TaxID=2635139 RepID=UPI003B9DBEFB
MNRRNIIFKNVSLSLIFKTVNMGVVFLTIPILLEYLDKEQYGVWATLFSLVNIIFFVDGGIGNGLKTKLSEAISKNHIVLARQYISTAYFSIFIIAIVVFLIGLIAIYNINLQSLFNTTLNTNELRIVLTSLLSLVSLGFLLSLYKSLFYATQKAAKVELSMLIYQVLICITLFLCVKFFERSLLFVALIYGISNVLTGLVFTVLFFKRRKDLVPSIRFFSRSKINDLLALSMGFFVIQLCMIVIFTTDNLIIANQIHPSEVTSYDIVYKLFQVLIMLSLIAQDPLWALYTDAYQKGDYHWIKKTIFRLNKLFLLFLIVLLALYFVANSIIKIWTQKDLEISQSLLVLMAVFAGIRVYGIIYMNFLNSIGKIKIQMWLYIFGALINIPISIYLVNTTTLGSGGVILGTCISIVSLSVLLPIQTFNILKRNEIN